MAGGSATATAAARMATARLDADAPRMRRVLEAMRRRTSRSAVAAKGRAGEGAAGT